MSDAEPDRLTVGAGPQAREIAVLRRPGRAAGIFWLGGFRSDMTGAKAGALDSLGARMGHAVTRFDYSGHGASGGSFETGSISRWLEEAEAVFATTDGPQVVVGSSMGGWIALLLARRLATRASGRLKALVLIAPAVDMTEELMRASLRKKDLKALATQGYVEVDSDYGGSYRISAAFLEDGRQHLLLGRPIEPGGPVTVLQGGKDRDVPKELALRLVAHIVTDPVSFTLIPDGDHRLSREEDLRLLEGAVERALAE